MLSDKFQLLVEAIDCQEEQKLLGYGKDVLGSSTTQFEILFVLENVTSLAKDAWQSLPARPPSVLRRICQNCPDLRKDVWEYWDNLGIDTSNLVDLIRQVPEMLTLVMPTLHRHVLSREQFESVLPFVAEAEGLNVESFRDSWDMYPLYFSNAESLDDSWAIYYLYDTNVGPSLKQREAIEQTIQSRPKAILDSIPTELVLVLSKHSGFFSQLLVESVRKSHRPGAYLGGYGGGVWHLLKDYPDSWLSCWNSLLEQIGQLPWLAEAFCHAPVFVDSAWNQYLTTRPDNEALARIVESKSPFSLPAANVMLKGECSNGHLLTIFRNSAILQNEVLQRFDWNDLEGSELQVVFPSDGLACKEWNFQVDGTACRQKYVSGECIVFAISDHRFFNPAWWDLIPHDDRALMSYDEYDRFSPTTEFLSKFEIECNKSFINPMFVGIVVTRFECEAWVEVDVQFLDGSTRSGFLTWRNSD